MVFALPLPANLGRGKKDALQAASQKLSTEAKRIGLDDEFAPKYWIYFERMTVLTRKDLQSSRFAQGMGDLINIWDSRSARSQYRPIPIKGSTSATEDSNHDRQASIAKVTFVHSSRLDRPRPLASLAQSSQADPEMTLAPAPSRSFVATCWFTALSVFDKTPRANAVIFPIVEMHIETLHNDLPTHL
ncbi:MAG: hypothetical protein JOY54_18860 [Acidobacteriaceae bacterium]|nr:hypothetical protein [Acidobacteriaceae bacterium]